MTKPNHFSSVSTVRPVGVKDRISFFNMNSRAYSFTAARMTVSRSHAFSTRSVVSLPSRW